VAAASREGPLRWEDADKTSAYGAGAWFRGASKVNYVEIDNALPGNARHTMSEHQVHRCEGGTGC
jgi:hypothetical protein